MADPLIPPHGGYRRLKSFQVAQLVYDVTVPFCDSYIEKRSRTHDQMVQAARSGVQNIAEGSQASGTSKKMELKLTNVARASLEELRLDYEDFLRQREWLLLPPDHPAMQRFKQARCASVEAVRQWVAAERALKTTDDHGPARTDTDGAEPPPDGTPSVVVRGRPCSSGGGARRLSSAALAANAALSLLNVACHLLDRQVQAQAAAFEQHGGFTERLHHHRTRTRAAPPTTDP